MLLCCPEIGLQKCRSSEGREADLTEKPACPPEYGHLTNANANIRMDANLLHKEGLTVFYL